MKFIFFDCETTGKPLQYNASYEDVNNWPRVTSLAAILSDINGNTISQLNQLIKPDG